MHRRMGCALQVQNLRVSTNRVRLSLKILLKSSSVCCG